MDWHIITLLLLQIINITVSALTPIISNFMQSITNSECCGLRIKRNITQTLKRVKSIKTDLVDRGTVNAKVREMLDLENNLS